MKCITKAWTVYISSTVNVMNVINTSTDNKQVCIVSFVVAKAFD